MVPLATLLEVLLALHEEGVQFIDISRGDAGPGQDAIRIGARPEKLKNGEELDTSVEFFEDDETRDLSEEDLTNMEDII